MRNELYFFEKVKTSTFSFVQLVNYSLPLFQACFPMTLPHRWRSCMAVKHFHHERASTTSFMKRKYLKEDYLHAENVYQKFECQSMIDYLLLYVRTDVALLADIFLKFRNFMFEQFKLDPCHFISLPGFLIFMHAEND